MTRHSFGPSHPLWGELVDLRRSGHFIKDLLKIAHDRGYTDLTYRKLEEGFRQVASGFGLPTRSAVWLRRKHERTAKLVQAYETMTFALMEALEDWQAVKAERSEGSQSEAYRVSLARREEGLRDKVFDYSERIAKLDIELHRLNAAGGEGWGNTPGFVITDVETMQRAVGTIMERFALIMQQRLGGPDASEAAAARFGRENVRPEIIEGEGRPPEEEELFVDAEDA